MKFKGFKIKAKKITIVTALIIVGIGFITFSFMYWGTYSEGFRAGIVTKVSKKGYFVKTYEGELNTSEMEKWSFSVESDEEEVLKILEEVSLSRERVKLLYKERPTEFSWRGDTKYFVYQVERISNDSTSNQLF